MISRSMIHTQIFTNCEIVNPSSNDGPGVCGEDGHHPPVVGVGEHVQAPARYSCGAGI